MMQVLKALTGSLPSRSRLVRAVFATTRIAWLSLTEVWRTMRSLLVHEGWLACHKQVENLVMVHEIMSLPPL